VAESRRTDSVNEELQLEQDREAPEQELDD
jgi:hypothetical protein